MRRTFNNYINSQIEAEFIDGSFTLTINGDELEVLIGVEEFIQPLRMSVTGSNIESAKYKIDYRLGWLEGTLSPKIKLLTSCYALCYDAYRTVVKRR